MASLTLLLLAATGACASAPRVQPVGKVSAPTQTPSHGTTHPASPAPSASPRLSAPPAQAALDPVVQRLAPYLQRHFGNSYSSVLVDSPNNQLVVYRIPDTRLDSAARAVAGPVHLSFVNSRYSYARQQQLLNRILADRGYWGRHGVTVNSVGTSNGVHCAALVDVSEHPASAQRAFDARYGAGAVRVSQRGPLKAA
ncbi:hypothetical protein [Streptacidiphilus sp. MAP12-16]|uniref:hypothetical protein n=1 Tax=Streptacidiphilus sp. MAP12-16 TaxID=3156300 RepID=UPI0035160950